MERDGFKRDYRAMREILEVVARAGNPVGYSALRSCADQKTVAYEVTRLMDDGLVNGDMRFNVFKEYMGGEVRGFTDEGREFYNLVAKGEAWNVMLEALTAADINIPYPLLKEVCEEVVKRYVISFIPEEVRHGR